MLPLLEAAQEALGLGWKLSGGGESSDHLGEGRCGVEGAATAGGLLQGFV
jgi:hypothetical protein